MTVCASVSTVTVGSYQFNDYVSNRCIFDSLNIQFKEVASTNDAIQTPIIEYGDTSFDLNSLIETSEGDVTLPALDVTRVGEQALTFKATKEKQEKEFTKVITIQETKAPEIVLTADTTSIPFESEFDVASLVESVSDPVDGIIELESEGSASSFYKIEGSVDTSVAGDYTITVFAIDKNGNKTSTTSIVTVEEKEAV